MELGGGGHITKGGAVTDTSLARSLSWDCGCLAASPAASLNSLQRWDAPTGTRCRVPCRRVLGVQETVFRQSPVVFPSVQWLFYPDSQHLRLPGGAGSGHTSMAGHRPHHVDMGATLRGLES